MGGAPPSADRWARSSAATSLFSAAALLTARYLSADAVYYASWSRFAEILAGAALAAVVAGRTVPATGGARSRRCASPPSSCSPSSRRRRSGWAYEGGLPLFALLTVGLIVGLQPASPLRQAALAPAARLGRTGELRAVPVPLARLPARQRRHDRAARVPRSRSVRIGITVAISAAVFHAIEQPVRTKRRRWHGRVRCSPAPQPASLALLVAVALFVPAGPPRPRSSSDRARRDPAGAGRRRPRRSAVRTVAPSAPRRTAAPPRSTTVAIFGDSVADWLLRDAASSYVRTDYTIVNGAHEACDGAINLPTARDRRGKKLHPPADCQEWPQSYPPVVEDPAHPVDVAVLVLGQAPYPDRLFGDQWLGPCDSDGLVHRRRQPTHRLPAQHVRQVVLALPSWSGAHVTFMMPDDHRARMACIRTALQAMATASNVPVVDLATLAVSRRPGRRVRAVHQRRRRPCEPGRRAVRPQLAARLVAARREPTQHAMNRGSMPLAGETREVESWRAHGQPSSFRSAGSSSRSGWSSARSVAVAPQATPARGLASTPTARATWPVTSSTTPGRRYIDQLTTALHPSEFHNLARTAQPWNRSQRPSMTRGIPARDRGDRCRDEQPLPDPRRPGARNRRGRTDLQVDAAAARIRSLVIVVKQGHLSEHDYALFRQELSDATVDAWNAMVDRAVAGLPNVTVVDPNFGWDADAMIYDVHPTNAGEDHIAQLLFATAGLPWHPPATP